MEVDRLPFKVVRVAPGRSLAPVREFAVAWEASAREGPDGSTRWEASRRRPPPPPPPGSPTWAYGVLVPPTATIVPAIPPDVEGVTLEAVLEGALEFEAAAAGLAPMDLHLMRAELD